MSTKMIGGSPISEGDPLDVRVGANEAHIGLVGETRLVACWLWTRPNDTTQYAAGDVVTNVSAQLVYFNNVVRKAGGGGMITDAALLQGVNQATKLQADLFLFQPDVLTSPSDNAPWAPAMGDLVLNNLVGVISFDEVSPIIAGNIVIQQARNVGLVFRMSSPYSRGLQGILVARNAYTPVANEQFCIHLKTISE